MKIPTSEAARQLGMPVASLILELSKIVGELKDCWPEMDEGYVKTLEQMLGLPQRKGAQHGGIRPKEARKAPRAAPDPAARIRILDKLERANRWGANGVSMDTLRNHYCHNVEHLEDAISKLVDDSLVLLGDRGNKRRGPFSLNPARKGEVEQVLKSVRHDP